MSDLTLFSACDTCVRLTIAFTRRCSRWTFLSKTDPRITLFPGFYMSAELDGSMSAKVKRGLVLMLSGSPRAFYIFTTTRTSQTKTPKSRCCCLPSSPVVWAVWLVCLLIAVALCAVKIVLHAAMVAVGVALGSALFYCRWGFFWLGIPTQRPL